MNTLSQVDQERLLAEFPDYHGLNYTKELFELISKQLSRIDNPEFASLENKFYNNDYLILRNFMKKNIDNPSDINTRCHKLFDHFYDQHVDITEFESNEFHELLLNIRDELNSIQNNYNSRIVKLEVFIDTYKKSGKWYQDYYKQYELAKEDLGILWYDQRMMKIKDEIKKEVIKMIKNYDMNHVYKIKAIYMDGHTDIVHQEMLSASVIVDSILRLTDVKMTNTTNVLNNDEFDTIDYHVLDDYSIPVLNSKERGAFKSSLNEKEQAVLDDFNEFIKLNGPFSFVTYNQVNNCYTFYRNDPKGE
jgi:hypothetical protein